MTRFYFTPANGVSVYPIGGQTNTTLIRSQPFTSADIVYRATLPRKLGTLSGNWIKQTDGTWYEISSPSGVGYVRGDVIRFGSLTELEFLDKYSDGATQPDMPDYQAANGPSVQTAGMDGFGAFALAALLGLAWFGKPSKKGRK